MRDPKWIFKQYGACLCKAGIRKREEIERSIKNYPKNAVKPLALAMGI
jgi:hypothetical protein